MQNLGIAVVVALISCVLAQSPTSFEETCALPREPYRKYDECLVKNFPQSVVTYFSASWNCLGVNSAFELFEHICEKIEEGDSAEFGFMLELCDPRRLGVTGPTNEDFDEAMKVVETCKEVLGSNPLVTLK